jgi:3-oxoacyl-[acyl-carrier protein] reductase
MNARRVIVVTGSSSGLGQAMALAFAEPGNLVVVHGNKNVEGLRACEQAVVARGAECLSIQADLSLATSRESLVEKAFAWKGRVDVWINAAGADVLTGDGKLLNFNEKLDRLWQVDVVGTIQISRAAADRMLRQSSTITLPTILNISWDQAEMGMEGDSGQYFSATKAAIAAFSRSLAKSVGPKVRVNCIAPGWIQTAWGNTASPEWDRRARGESLLKRWGTVDDIAQTALFLSDKRSEFINGQVIAVNGGRADIPSA